MEWSDVYLNETGKDNSHEVDDPQHPSRTFTYANDDYVMWLEDKLTIFFDLLEDFNIKIFKYCPYCGTELAEVKDADSNIP